MTTFANMLNQYLDQAENGKDNFDEYKVAIVQAGNTLAKLHALMEENPSLILIGNSTLKTEREYNGSKLVGEMTIIFRVEPL